MGAAASRHCSEEVHLGLQLPAQGAAFPPQVAKTEDADHCDNCNDHYREHEAEYQHRCAAYNRQCRSQHATGWRATAKAKSLMGRPKVVGIHC